VPPKLHHASRPSPEAARFEPAASGQSLECFAIVTPGLEQLALAEARALGISAELEEKGGGLAWVGDVGSVLRANVGLRIASRVLVRLASFQARTFAELERHARQIGWARIVAPGESARFRVTSKKSRLYHTDAIAQRLADGLVRAVPGVHVEEATAVGDDEVHAPEDAQLFVVRVHRDHFTVSADSSGDLLHRRGYRQETAKAPVRETLAAALIAASGWDLVSPLVDPLCGSGTIPIEAALMARGIAPGAKRSFAAERWPGVPKTLGERVRMELADRRSPVVPGPMIGSDRDMGAVAAAVANAERAGVAGDVALSMRALSAAEFPGEHGWIVTNPPYGVRVGDADRVRDLWAQLGHVLGERARGWKVAILSPDSALDRQLRIPVRAVAHTSNGGIPVRLMVGEIGR
jgi:putative N6-adenine-specific DNA methylase